MYVSGLADNITEEDLRSLFAKYGAVMSVNLVKEGSTGQCRGFGFVEMPVREEAKKAMDELAGMEINGRTLSVEQARERKRSGNGPRDKRGGRSRSGGGGGFGGDSRRGGRSGGRKRN